ncbi:hypothetical protein CRH09_27590 [Nocardia terpenica]|uniref:HTH cro/C1-type domain-containing protein n=1 Tax=Nocardia terpenica TaxID=455432 RepID=A0A291RPX3_9NOCA|nr:hypothetical protein CRH09_27590 [Nocardia terpenica]
MSFGNELRTRRLAEGLSLGELAKILHYSKGHLSRIETGSKRASEDLARQCDRTLCAEGRLLLAWTESVETSPRPRGRMPPPVQLPSISRYFTGRRDAIATLNEVLVEPADRPGATRVVLVNGTVGVGKTTLALEWAYRNISAFPDGILFRDLHAYGHDNNSVDVGDVLTGFLSALGIDNDAIPEDVHERATLFRSTLARCRMLIILDNVRSAEQVRLLFPNSPLCVVLVTSRHRLPGLAAREGARRVALGPLSPEESCEVLRAITTAAGRSIPTEESAALLELAQRCDYLPLALRIAGERYSSGRYTCLADLIADLSRATSPLDFLELAEDSSMSIRSAFSWSYNTLAREDARAFRLVGPRSGAGISVQAAAELLGVPPPRACRHLDTLYQAGLLELVTPGVYRTGTLLGAYATELARRQTE